MSELEFRMNGRMYVNERTATKQSQRQGNFDETKLDVTFLLLCGKGKQRKGGEGEGGHKIKFCV
jgi:hypothetical protein